MYPQHRHHISHEAFEMFTQKVRDWHLQQDPCFRWCIKCDNGFVHENNHLRMNCPKCHSKFCFNCHREVGNVYISHDSGFTGVKLPQSL